jgi:hypothetical protein
LYP